MTAPGPPADDTVSLRDLLMARPAAFYAQSWYWRERFLDTRVARPAPDAAAWPTKIVPLATAPAAVTPLPRAATLAALYLHDPTHAIWAHYLWCADRDDAGQRVYLGVNGHGLEIHRHLHLSPRWGLPLWPAP